MLTPTATALEKILVDFVNRGLPPRRIARLAGLLLLSEQYNTSWFNKVANLLKSQQHPDGGWVDCEDTAWCSWVQHTLGEQESARRGVNWIEKERSGAAWGYCQRDTPNIPITATMRLLNVHGDELSESWLRETWSKDFHGTFKLSYKAAWYLLACGASELDEKLATLTECHLLQDQRQNGSWGPWNNHPAPTDCFATGLTMLALAKRGNEATHNALDKAIAWCKRTRLPNGLFPTHYIDEGSAWLLLGWSYALKQLK